MKKTIAIDSQQWQLLRPDNKSTNRPMSGKPLLMGFLPGNLGVLLFLLTVFFPTHAIGEEYLPNIKHLSRITEKVSSTVRLAVNLENIYVSDTVKQSVHAFGILGKFESSVNKLAKPVGIALDAEGNCYIGDDSGKKVSLYDSADHSIKFELGIGIGEFEMPSDIDVDHATGRVYVSDSEANVIRVYDSKGNREFVIGDLFFPTGIHIDSHKNELLVSDSGNNEIKVFDLSGNLLRSFGLSIQEGGQIGTIYGLASDNLGRIYVADSYKNSVLVFDSVGNFLLEIGKEELITPIDVAIDSYNRLLVSSYGNSSVIIYGIDGGDVSSALFSINNSAPYTNSAAVNLSIKCRNDTCREMRFRNVGSTWSEEWKPFHEIAAWNLTTNDGVKKVVGEFMDRDGKITTHYAVITMDTLPPIGSITIANGQEATSSTSVDLNISANDNVSVVSGMRLRIDNGAWAEWEKFSTHKSFALTGGYGLKSVSIQFRDAAGNISSSYSDSIIFDPNAPAIQTTDPDTLKIFDFKSGRIDGSGQYSNLDAETDNPRMDVEYEFKITIRDPSGGPPQYARFFITQRGVAQDDDFYSHNLTCNGSWSNGALCIYITKLGPAAKHKYHFEAMLADGSVVRYPETGEIDGPTVELLNGGNLVGIPRGVSSLSGTVAFGTSQAYRWIYDSNKTGKFEPVDENNPIKPGEGYLVQREEGAKTLPQLEYIDDIKDPEFSLKLNTGWNLISNPYAGNVNLTDVRVQKGTNELISWIEAVKEGILVNASYYYKGSDWGSAYSFESAGSDPDSILIPWVGYWVYLKNSDAVYSLVISRPD